MKNTTARAWIPFITFGVAALLLPCGVAGQGSAGGEVLTNESVVQMVVGKVPKDLILAKIQSTSTAFDVTANGLVRLYKSKVSTDTIKLMMRASAGNGSREVLANDGVVQMVTSRLPRGLILAKIESTKPGFDLTAAGLVTLSQNKVPQDVVKAMMAAAANPTSASTPAPSPQRASSAQSTGAPGPSATQDRPRVDLAQLNAEFKELEKRKIVLLDAYTRTFGTPAQRDNASKLIDHLRVMQTNRMAAQKAGQATAGDQVAQISKEIERVRR